MQQRRGRSGDADEGAFTGRDRPRADLPPHRHFATFESALFHFSGFPAAPGRYFSLLSRGGPPPPSRAVPSTAKKNQRHNVYPQNFVVRHLNVHVRYLVLLPSFLPNNSAASTNLLLLHAVDCFDFVAFLDRSGFIGYGCLGGFSAGRLHNMMTSWRESVAPRRRSRVMTFNFLDGKHRCSKGGPPRRRRLHRRRRRRRHSFFGGRLALSTVYRSEISRLYTIVTYAMCAARRCAGSSRIHTKRRHRGPGRCPTTKARRRHPAAMAAGGGRGPRPSRVPRKLLISTKLLGQRPRAHQMSGALTAAASDRERTRRRKRALQKRHLQRTGTRSTRVLGHSASRRLRRRCQNPPRRRRGTRQQRRRRRRHVLSPACVRECLARSPWNVSRQQNHSQRCERPSPSSVIATLSPPKARVAPPTNPVRKCGRLFHVTVCACSRSAARRCRIGGQRQRRGK